MRSDARASPSGGRLSQYRIRSQCYLRRHIIRLAGSERAVCRRHKEPMHLAAIENWFDGRKQLAWKVDREGAEGMPTQVKAAEFGKIWYEAAYESGLAIQLCCANRPFKALRLRLYNINLCFLRLSFICNFSSAILPPRCRVPLPAICQFCCVRDEGFGRASIVDRPLFRALTSPCSIVSLVVGVI